MLEAIREIFHEFGEEMLARLDKHKLKWRDRYRLVYRLFGIDGKKNLLFPDMGFLLIDESLKPIKEKRTLSKIIIDLLKEDGYSENELRDLYWNDKKIGNLRKVNSERVDAFLEVYRKVCEKIKDIYLHGDNKFYLTTYGLNKLKSLKSLENISKPTKEWLEERLKAY